MKFKAFIILLYYIILYYYIMEAIIKLIKDYKNLSKTTLKVYSGNIFRIFNYINNNDSPFEKSILYNKNKIIEFIEGKKALQSKKLYYATLVSIGKAFDISEEDFNYYREKLMDLKNEYDKNKLEQKKSIKQSDNWIDYKKLFDTYKYYKKLITLNKIRKKKELNKKEYKLLFKFIILSLFLSDPRNNPPRRAGDYANMMIVKENPNNKDFNYIIKNKKIVNPDNKFIFNKYKTAKTYGTQICQIGRILNNDLNLWFKFNKSNKFLLHNTNDPDKPLGTNNLTKILTSIFVSKYKKKISVNMIRSITLTEIYKDMPNLKSLDEIASKMGHSVNEALINYVKKD